MIKHLLKNQHPFNLLPLLLLRVSFGGLFMYHGFDKLRLFDQYVAHFPDFLHIGSEVSLVLALIAELVGGFLVALGLLTRLAVIPILITMLFAFFGAHAHSPFEMKELPLVFLVIGTVIFLSGGGHLSVDKQIFNK